MATELIQMRTGNERGVVPRAPHDPYIGHSAELAAKEAEATWKQRRSEEEAGM